MPVVSPKWGRRWAVLSVNVAARVVFPPPCPDRPAVMSGNMELKVKTMNIPGTDTSAPPSRHTLRVPAQEWVFEGCASNGEASRAATKLVMEALEQPPAHSGFAPVVGPRAVRLKLNADTLSAIGDLAAKTGLSDVDVDANLLKHMRPVVESCRIAQADAARAAEDARQAKQARICAAADEILASRDRPRVRQKDNAGRIELRFPYSEAAIMCVKELPGAKWSKVDNCWSVSSKYRKRVDQCIPEIETAVALEWATCRIEFAAAPPPPTKRAKVRLKGADLQTEFLYNKAAVALFQELKEDGVALYNGRAWFVSWRNREHLYAILPTLEALLTKPKP